jgi:hypothetical protein
VGVEHLDFADPVSGNSGLAGDGAHEVARLHAVPFSHCDEELRHRLAG